MRIIVFEGIDASGKETQISLLEKYLIDKGFKVRTVSFPRYENPIGELIKRGLRGEVDIAPKALHLLFEVDRLDYMRELESFSNDIDFLLVDRYILSNLVYCTANQLSIDYLQSVIEEELFTPDLTLLLDISAETSFERRTVREDAFESNKEFLKKSRDLYHLVYADSYKKLKVDNFDVNDTSKLVINTIKEYFVI